MKIVDIKPSESPTLNDVEVPQNILENWQITVDLLAQMVGIPASLIMRVHSRDIEVCVSSLSPGNVYSPGEKMPLDTGLYCETVMNTRQRLLVPNALKDPDWNHNPDLAFGMISYCGLPLVWPNGKIFGTLCILDQEENEYSPQALNLLERFRDSIQFNLNNLYEASLACRQRTLAESALHDSESRFRQLIEHAPIPLCHVAQGGVIQHFNQRFAQVFGYTAEDIPTLDDWWQRACPDPTYRNWARTTWMQAVTTALSEKRDIRPNEYQITCKNGETRIMEISGDALGEDFLATFIDLTERKRAEAELEQYRHHLEARVEARTQELAAANQTISLEMAQLKAAEEKLDAFNRDFESFLDQTSDFIYFKDADSRFIFCSQTLAEVTGHQNRREMIGKHDREVFPPDTARIYEEEEAPVFAEGRPLLNKINPYYDPAGRLGYVQTNKWPLFDPTGKVTGIFGISRDITERVQADAELRIAAIAFEMQESLMITDTNGVILRVNQAFTESTGYSAAEVVGKTPQLLKSGRHNADFYRKMWRDIHLSGAWQGEVWDRRKNGEIYPKWLTITAVKTDNGAVTHYVASHLDITERKRAEEEIRNLAFYDALTGLPNRRLLNERLCQMLIVSKRTACYGALMFIDLDNFKPLNDIHGHVVGDLLLIEVAHRLTACIRETDTVARFGGDEFVVMLSELDTDKQTAEREAQHIAEKIRTTLSAPYLLIVEHEDAPHSTVTHHCSASIGVAVFVGSQSRQDEIMQWADSAMYQAKQAGRDAIRFFESSGIGLNSAC